MGQPPGSGPTGFNSWDTREARGRLRQACNGLHDDDFKISSEEDHAYNCVAWAVGVNDVWLWPSELGGMSWPAELEVSDSLDNFRAFFSEHFGYSETDIQDVLPVRGVERVAIFADDEDAVTHVSRQDPSDGWWHSKMGRIEDIRHRHPSNLEGGSLGHLGAVMKRGVEIPDPKPQGHESLWLPNR